MFEVRDVIRLWDRHTNPEKPKIHICVCPERQRFLRINTKPIFRPHHKLLKKDNPFLDHDSYVSLISMVRHMAYEIGRAQLKGHLSEEQARLLCASARAAKTLSDEDKDFICGKLCP